MKNTYLSIAGVLAFLFVLASCQDNQLLNPGDSMVAGVAGVTSGGVAGVFIDEIDDLEVTNFPQSVNISGYVGYLSDLQGNYPRLKRLQILVNGEERANAQRSGNGDQSAELGVPYNNPGQIFSVFLGGVTPTFEILEEGTYIVTAKAWFTTHSSDQTVDTENSYDGTEEFEVTVDFTVDYPAAPSVASSLLKAAGIDARWGQGRSGGNYIADVAQHMGQGATFNGVEKNDWQDYRCEVADFLNVRFKDTLEEGRVESCPAE